MIDKVYQLITNKDLIHFLMKGGVISYVFLTVIAIYFLISKIDIIYFFQIKKSKIQVLEETIIAIEKMTKLENQSRGITQFFREELMKQYIYRNTGVLLDTVHFNKLLEFREKLGREYSVKFIFNAWDYIEIDKNKLLIRKIEKKDCILYYLGKGMSIILLILSAICFFICFFIVGFIILCFMFGLSIEAPKIGLAGGYFMLGIISWFFSNNFSTKTIPYSHAKKLKKKLEELNPKKENDEKCSKNPHKSSKPYPVR